MHFKSKLLEFGKNIIHLELYVNNIYLRPKVTLHCYYIYLFWVLVSGILNVFNS